MRYGIVKMIGVTVAVMLTGWLGSASIGHATNINFAALTFGNFPTLDFNAAGNVTTPALSVLNLTPKSLVPPPDLPLSNPTNSLTEGGPGSLFIGDLGNMDASDNNAIGMGVQNFKPSESKIGGSKAFSGERKHDDELIIFDFLSSFALASSISLDMVGLNNLGCVAAGTCTDDDDVISLMLEFSDLSTLVITSLEIGNAIIADAGGAVNGPATLNFSSLGSLAGTSLVKRFAIRVTNGHWGLSGTSFDVNPVPEPSSMLLFGTGLAGLAFFRRKRKLRV